jgi:hypothetical protein
MSEEKRMPDAFSEYYADFLHGTYDCVDRVVLNAYFPLGGSPGGFRTWWRALYGSDDNLDNAHLMRLAGRFSRRIHGWAAKNQIPVIKCPGHERAHEVLEEECPDLPKRPGVFCVMVKRAPFPIWEVRRFGERGIDLHKKKKPMPYVNHYAFHVLDKDWGHMIFKVCGHPPFTVQILVNGHEYVANAARKQRLKFTKEDNCFTDFANAAGLQKVADTLRSSNAIGRLKQACAHWLYQVCLCLALDVAEQKKSGFWYEFVTYQAEYSRNLLFREGRALDKVFQGVIDRTRAALDVKTVKTIFGRRRRGQHQSRWEVVVERSSYDLTVFKIHCGKLTLKMYSKGERILRIEAIVHNTRVLGSPRSLETMPQLVERLQAMLERFLQVVRCVDVACLDDRTWEELPTPSQVGKARVAGVDMNKPRMRAVLQAVLALAVLPQRWGSAAVAAKVCALRGWSPEQYQPRQASYDLKKLRGKELIRQDGRRYYEATVEGLQTIAALAILQDKVIKPVLAKALNAKSRKTPAVCDASEAHYAAVHKEIAALCQAFGLAAAA